MRFVITNNDYQIRTITMQVWNGHEWSPDFFADMETSIPQECDYNEDLDGYEMTAIEFEETVEYWKNEVDAANDGRWSEQFGDWSESHPNQEIGLWL